MTFTKKSPRAALSKGQNNGEQHILLRVRSDGGDTIAAHNAMVNAKGAALLGKMGKPLGEKFVNILNDEIADGKATYLFLTTREGWNGPYVTYQCKLRCVYPTLPSGKEELIPAYYFSERGKASTWFEISAIGKMSKEEMNRIKVRSSGRVIMSVISSSAVVFYVTYPGGMASPIAKGDLPMPRKNADVSTGPDSDDDGDQYGIASQSDLVNLGIDRFA